MFRWLPVLGLLLTIVKCDMNKTVSDNCPNVKTHISAIRKRRHLVFPDDSVAGITISLAKSFHTHAPSGWYMTSDLDVLFPLPDSKFTNAHFRRKLHHRQKKEVWERLKHVLYLHNINGHDCVLRSICEAKEHLAPPGRSLVHDLLRAIFTVPLSEPDFAVEVRDTYSELLDPDFCKRVYDCPLSILHFILSFNKQK